MKDSVNINGIEVGPSTDIRSLLRNEFLGGSVLAGRYDEGPEAGVRSLFEAATGTGLERGVLAALKSLLTDTDVKVRAGAVGLVLHYAEKFDPSELLAILDRNRALYNDVPLPGGSIDLAWALMRAIAASPTQDAKVVARLRRAVQEPAKGNWILAGLASNDTEWVIKHPQEILDDDPARARIVVFRLDPNARERFVRGLPRESPRLREIVADAVLAEVKDSAEKDRLLQLLA